MVPQVLPAELPQIGFRVLAEVGHRAVGDLADQRAQIFLEPVEQPVEGDRTGIRRVAPVDRLDLLRPGLELRRRGAFLGDLLLFLLRLARTDLAREAQGDLQRHRAEDLVDRDPGDEESGERVHLLREARRVTHEAGEGDRHAGLTEETHPTVLAGVVLGATDDRPDLHADPDGEDARGHQAQGEEAEVHDLVEVQPRAGDGEEDHVDRRAQPLDRVDEGVARLGEVRYDEAGGQEDEHPVEVELTRHEGRGVDHTDDEEQQLLVHPAQVGRDHAADGGARGHRAEDLDRELGGDRFPAPRAEGLGGDRGEDPEEDDDDDVLDDDGAEHRSAHRALGAGLVDDGDGGRRRGGEGDRRDGQADPPDGRTEVAEAGQRDRRDDAADGIEEEGDDEEDGDQLEAEDAEDRPDPLAQPIELELTTGRQRDERDGERIERAQEVDDIGVEHALVEGWPEIEGDEASDRRTEEHPRQQVAGDVRQLDDVDELADGEAREDDEAEG